MCQCLQFYCLDINHKTVTGNEALYHNGEVIKRDGYTTDVFTDAAVEFIEEKASDPFFLYVAYNSMLPPYAPPGQEDKKDSFDLWKNGTRADYVASVEHLDKSVGRILDTLEQQNLTDETVVVLTYDHGGAELATSGKFFHGFGTLWEGGIRVPMILNWPANVEKGIVCSEATILMDVAPTVLTAAGVKPDQPMDGLNLLADNNLSNEPRTLFWRIDLASGNEALVQRLQRAVRRGKWKYLRDGLEFLYDLEEDPGERHNLSYQHPELLAELRELSKGDWY